MRATSKKIRSRLVPGRVRKAAKARTRQRLRPPPLSFRPPVLHGGTGWIGGSVARTDLYGDDGR